MIIKLKYKIIAFSSLAILLMFSLIFLFQAPNPIPKLLMGGSVSTVNLNADIPISVANQVNNYFKDNEKYHRPSKKQAIQSHYTFQSYENKTFPEITSPYQAVEAYFGVLQESSNMLGYGGGCGSIGNEKEPYPVAYSILSNDMQKHINLNQFIDSFKGIGHISSLQILEITPVQNVSKDSTYFAVEIETITGKKIPNLEYNPDNQLSYFDYYYGIVEVVKSHNEYKINNIILMPEAFLCAPYHSWFYDSKAVIGIIYIDNLKLINNITKTEQINGYTYIYATGDGGEYRFDFITLTNGYDVLVGENIMQNGEWKSTSFLTEDWKGFRLTI